MFSLPGNVGILWSVAWSPDGERIAATSDNGHYCLDARPGYEISSRIVIPWWITGSSLDGNSSRVEAVPQESDSKKQVWHDYIANLDSHVVDR